MITFSLSWASTPAFFDALIKYYPKAESRRFTIKDPVSGLEFSVLAYDTEPFPVGYDDQQATKDLLKVLYPAANSVSPPKDAPDA